ncbi:MAG: autotransporter-associated beta strand repeat-containing protein, partial [Pirellulales bacterium]|nr:autotransporter-associated beta strand repeat-containing protein [Pirellulales bacterium]
MRTCPRCLFSTMSLIGVLTIGAFYSGQFLFADSFDWRSVNGGYWVSNVRDQYDSKCYIYGSVASLESVYMLTRNDPSFRPDLSERQPWADGDVGGLPFTDGGDPEPVFDYFTSTGLVFETDCPMPTGSWPVTNWGSKVTKSVGNATASITTNNIKNLLKATGCVTCSLDADYDLFDSIAAVRDCGSPKSSWLPTCNHVVSIVGYYDDPLCDAGGYFVVKNSWDTWWGDGGFGYVPYGFMNVYDWVTDVCYLTGAAYRPTALATMTWKGGSGTWIAGGTNWTGTDIYGTSYPSYAWQNIETSATFNASSGTNITINGKVIAHGLTISSGAQNYVFNGVNNPSLTVTHGGITAHETVTINAPVTIGAPQSWTIDAGKTLTIGGDLHTIISHLDINGDGDTTITGAIDGGGALNAAGAAPGSITKNGAGTLHLTGAVTYSVPLIAASGAVSFEQAGTDVAYYVGNISGGANVNKSNSGTIVLTGTNSHTGWTQIYNGVMQADRGAGLANGAVVLFGGVLQSNGAVTYKDSFWNDSPNNNCLSWFGGGFAGGGGKMTVNLYNDGRAVAWTGDGNSGIAGPIQLSSTTAQYEVEIQNVLDLNAAERTIYVADNPNTDDDRAVISGVITDLQAFTTDVWSGAILKTGPGTLVLTGENENGQGDGSRGNTTIADGVLQADRMVGLSDWAGLILNGGVLQSHSGAVTYAEPLWAYGSGALRVQWISGGFSAGGGKMTVNLGGAGATINFGDADGTHGIAGILKLSSNTAHYETELQNGLNLNGGARTIQVDNNPYASGDFATISGVISGTGAVTKTGAGTLYLRGAGNTFSGTTNITAGTVWLDKSSGAAIPGNLNIAGTGDNVYVQLNHDEQIGDAAVLSFSNSGNYARFYMNYFTETVAGISCSDGRGMIQYGDLIVNSGNDYFYNGYLRYATSFEKRGSGTQTLSGSHIYYTGGTTVTGGKLILQDTTHSTFRSTSITNNATLEFDTATADVAFSGSIGGSGALNKTGPYTLTLSGNNSYGGNTTISAGTLVLDSSAGAAVPGNLAYAGSATVLLNRDNQINPGKIIAFSSASSSQYLNLQGHDLTVAGIYLTAASDNYAAIQNQDAVDSLATLTVNNSGNYTYRGKIRDNNGASGRLALVKKGSGTLTIVGASSGGYTGGLRVENGILNYSGGELPACDYTVTGGTLFIGSLTQSIGTFQITGGTVSGTGALTSSAAYDVQAGVVDAALAGSVGLNKSGSGTAILTKNNPLTGATNITAGTLQFGNGGAGGGVAGNITDNAALIFNRADSFTYSGALY